MKAFFKSVGRGLLRAVDSIWWSVAWIVWCLGWLTSHAAKWATYEAGGATGITSWWFGTVLWFVLTIWWVYIAYRHVKRKSYDHGWIAGYLKALDIWQSTLRTREDRVPLGDQHYEPKHSL